MPGLMARAHRRAKSGGNSRLVHLFKNEAELFLGPTWTRSAPTPLQASLAGAQRHFLFIVSVMGADPRSDICVFVQIESCRDMHENHSSANDTQKMSTTFDYHPDPCIALRLALLGFSGGKGAPKVGLRASLRVRPGISTTDGCSIATCKARKRTMA